MLELVVAGEGREQEKLASMRSRAAQTGAEIQRSVAAIMEDGRARGYEAVEEYSVKFDQNPPREVSMEELEHHLDAASKRYIANNNIQLYTINAIDLAIKVGMGKRTNTILQSAFFSLAKVMPAEDAIKYMKDAAEHSYLKKGRDVVEKNWNAIDAGATAYVKIDVPASWATAEDNKPELALEGREDTVKVVKNILTPVGKMDGYSLPVSAFDGLADGQFPLGASAYEKRGVAVTVPHWDETKCIQCNNCAYVCPHATIRPYALTEAEAAAAPAGARLVDVKAGKGKGVYKYTMAVSPLDCMGCGVCVGVCPTKAITMVPQEQELAEQDVWNYMVAKVSEKKDMQDTTVKGSQFHKPLLEFSGSCAGCAETSYARLVTQLFGDRMYISNATGCSSIWGGPAATSPYTVNEEGHGPAWSNSLFEDNAEHGLGMYTAQAVIRESLANKVKTVMANTTSEERKAVCQNWLDTFTDGEANKAATKALIANLEANVCCDTVKDILSKKEYLSKKSIWIFGGDGWAYDIGFGGVDHVLATGEDVNIMVFDTEVYSNTGGQASKSTPTGAIAKFAATGKRTKKKDLALLAMDYGYVYVAQVSMGADMNQVVKAFAEAEAYHGPSIIIAYAPCINHGINMTKSQLEEKAAVDCGYWQLYRYNPEGEVFTLDSKEPNYDNYQSFLAGETRYSSLVKTQGAEVAQELFKQTEESAKERLEGYKKLAGKE